MLSILTIAKQAEDCELSFEGHPNNTTKAHVTALATHNFNRVCYGIQDNNRKVQKVIHRVHLFENIQKATAQARKEATCLLGMILCADFYFKPKKM